MSSIFRLLCAAFIVQQATAYVAGVVQHEVIVASNAQVRDMLFCVQVRL